MPTKAPKLGIPVNPRAIVITDENPDDFIGESYVPLAAPSPPTSAAQPRSPLAVANDTVIEAANAAAGGVGSAVEFFSPGNRFSKFIDDEIIRKLEESQSDSARQSRQQFQREMEAADSIGGELAAVARKVWRDPLLTAAQAVGSFVVPFGAVKAAGVAAKLAGLGVKGVTRAGMAGGSLAGATMAGGDAAGTAYDLIIKAGGTHDQAVAAAHRASVIPAIVGGAGGVIGAERLLAGGKGFAGGTLSRALKTGAVEAVQEGFEEGITQYEGQRAAVPFDPSIDPTKGVAGAASMGVVLGGATGGGMSLVAGGPAQVVPEVGPLSRAANVSTPDPRSIPIAVSPEQEAELLAHANKRMAELTEKAKGKKNNADGTTVPGVFLTPQEEGEREFLQAASGDVQALARVYQPVAPPSGDVPPIDEDAAIARMQRDSKRDAAESLGRSRAAARDETPPEAPQAPEATNPPVAPIAPEAPKAPETLDLSADLPLPDQDDILNPQGAPFKERFAAKRALTRLPDPENYVIAQVQGGYALRRNAQGNTSESTGTAAGSAVPDVGRSDQPAGGVGDVEAVPPVRAGVGAGDAGPDGRSAPGSTVGDAGDAALAVAADVLDSDILNPSREPFKEKAAASVAQKKNPGSTLVQVPGGWAVRPQPTALGDKIDAQPAGTRGTNAGDVLAGNVATAAQTIEDGAHDAAPSPNNDLPKPTDAQKKAGNYQKGHVRMGGLDLSIENPAGSVRRGKDRDGKAWERTLAHHYGYIRGTVGNDKDHVDLFVKPDTPLDFAGVVYVADQIHPDTGKFDEHKALVGFSDIEQARAAYAANYAKDWQGLKSITPMTFADFKAWVFDGPKNKALAQTDEPVPDAEQAPDQGPPTAKPPVAPVEPAPKPEPEAAPPPIEPPAEPLVDQKPPGSEPQAPQSPTDEPQPAEPQQEDAKPQDVSLNERVAARLSAILASFDADRRTPQGAARDDIRAVIDGLGRRPLADLLPILNRASNRLLRQFPAQSNTLDRIATELEAAPVAEPAGAPTPEGPEVAEATAQTPDTPEPAPTGAGTPTGDVSEPPPRPHNVIELRKRVAVLDKLKACLA